MNVLSRGVRNAFRNQIRTLSVVLILGLSIGLSLVMLIAHQAVDQKIKDVKSSVGNTITISPAGFGGFNQVSNALTASQLDKVKKLAHITSLTETLSGRLTTEGTTDRPAGAETLGNGSDNAGTTSLKSPVQLNINGSGGDNGGPSLFISGGGNLPTNFAPPVEVLGTNDPSHIEASPITITSGKTINGSKDTNNALISQAMADKNGLKVGSTFTAYDETLTIAGIFSSSTRRGDNTVILSLPTLERLSSQSGAVTGATATVDSLDNLASTTTAVKNALGSSADVQNTQTEADNAVKPLENVKSISLTSLIGAVIAGAIIIFLVMLMIVRERRREIGILKAIGASNLKVVWQFMAEAVTFTLLAALIGIIIGIFASSSVTNTLVNNATASNNSSNSFTGGGSAIQRFGTAGGGGSVSVGGGPGPSFVSRGKGLGAIRSNITNIHAAVGWTIILYGLAAAVTIALIGSTLASYLIAKVRPAEVMRAE